MHRGHDVIVSCASGVVANRLKEMGVRVSHFRPRGVIDPISGLSFAGWLAVQRPDALLLTSWHSLSWGAVSGATAGVRRIVLRQGIVRSAPRSGIKAIATKNLITDVIVNAPEIKEEWVRTAPAFPPERVHVVLNAVSPQTAARDDLKKRLRSETPTDDDAILIGAAGILSERKGFDLVLRAFAKARPKNTRVVIIGDGPYRNTLENLAIELGITDCVHFTGARENAAETIGGLDVFVLSSHNEGMANVMLEAMSAGVPVIASDISGVRTAIGPSPERPVAGWIFDPANVASLGDRIGEVVDLVRSSAPVVKERVDEAKYRINTWFTLDRMLDETERILFAK
jgi:glycosyltransferase involved in cell wall biosynthesis